MPAVPTDIVPDIGQASDAPRITGASGIPFDTTGTESQAMAETPTLDVVVPIRKNMRIGDIQIPPVGIDTAGIGGRITQVNDAVPTGIVGSLNKQTIQASGINIDAAALSGKMGAVSALSSQAFLDRIGGVVDVPQADVNRTGIDRGRAAQMPQIPLQKAIQAVPGGVLRDAAMHTMDVPNTVKSKENIPSVSFEIKSLTATEMPQEPVGDTKAIFSWFKGIADTCQTAWRIPEPDIPSKRSVIDEILDILSEKKKNLDTPVSSGRAPSFVYSPIIQVESSGDIKKDVEEANQMGMREFEQLMNEWLKKNKRTKFA